MIVIFDDEVTNNSIDGLIQEMKGLLPESSPDNKIDLFFSTNGGYLSFMYSFIYFLNRYSKNINVHIVNRLHSCGVDILTDFKGKIFIHHDTGVWMLIHNGDRPVQTLSQNGRIKEPKLLIPVKEHNKKQLEKFKKLGVKKKHLKKIKSGKDCILYSKDVKKLKAKNITHVV